MKKIMIVLAMLVFSTLHIDAVERERELLITGCARSGTKYIAAVLTTCGLNFGHEYISSFGVSSWVMAFPAKIVPWGDARNNIRFMHIFHQVRHPLKVISSAYTTEPQKSWDFIMQNIPQIRSSDSKLVKCAKYWYYWNLSVEQEAEWTYRIENLENVWEEFQDRLGINLDKTALSKIPRNFNHRGDHSDFTWKDLKKELDPFLYKRIRSLAKKYGYEIDNEE